VRKDAAGQFTLGSRGYLEGGSTAGSVRGRRCLSVVGLAQEEQLQQMADPEVLSRTEPQTAQPG